MNDRECGYLTSEELTRATQRGQRVIESRTDDDKDHRVASS